MWLFKSKPKAVSGHVSFLQKADACLDKAIATKDTRELPKYFDKTTCLKRMVTRVQRDNANDAGITRYRHVNWELLEDAGNTFTYVKDVSYDDIKVSKNLMAAVGDSYREIWKILILANGCTVVTEVRRLQEC